MKGFPGFIVIVLISQGIGGLAHELTDGWFRLFYITSRIGFLDGYEIYADIALIVLGIALAVAGTAIEKAAGKSPQRR